MKRSILYALLALCTFSCAKEVQETLPDQQDSFLDQLAQSDEYHNFFIAMRESQAAEEADPLDYETVTSMYENGNDIREMPETELAHIPGAITYVRHHQRSLQAIKALSARFPSYPNEMSFADRSELIKRYMAYRGVTPMDFVSADQLSQGQ